MIIIKNGTIVTESESYCSDIMIENNKISCIGVNLSNDNAEIIDALGMYIIPGAVDVHTHMDLQSGSSRSIDDFYTGTVAAVCGGTTSIVDHVAFGPKNCAIRHQIDEYHKLANGKAVIDYGFHGVIQHVNDEVLSGMESLAKEGISSFKIYMTYDFKLDDVSILKVLKKAKELGVIIAVHAENNDVINYLRENYVSNGCLETIYHAKSRPDHCEAEAISRVLHLAALAGDAPIYIVHISTEKGLDEIRKARAQGQKNIFSETCTQYLTMTEKKYLEPDNNGLKYVMSPPLRQNNDIAALWKGVQDGAINVIATDHCSFNLKGDKQKGINDFTKCPNGAPGVAERVRVIFSEGVMKKKISINRFVELLCTNPAKIYGLYPKKGSLIPGGDADITIINPNSEYTLTRSMLHGAVDYTCFEGMTLKGDIDIVIQSGKVAYKNNKFLGKKGDGKFIKRKVIE
ncbi:dihydropyrimidinase [Clostridium sp. 2-1]|uniref:dihydropyrimidinase n=1 Tax=Clostridium TaxID=1485 RepID=UPI000CDACEA7|nr:MULTISPECIES: dihydropyrimidinase [Clostridium]MBN7575717.1 dihydropyrimidinase [Clostridium beijerinckii]MBN7580937.1 dihydropyrimidinase [Clostridium beijerinckii]MBN7585493.1 dihydropyrimidinase [Clostridium beijerinckii]MBO0521190.1 dihydropyrimidinase [Clostridium beijerinckii]POO91199.1 dihydropyrimidinase [Clostridium sp. 2-1]